MFFSDLLAVIFSTISGYYLRQFIPNTPIYPWKLFIGYSAYYAIVILFFNTLTGLYRSTFRLKIRQQFQLAAKSYIFSVVFILSTLYLFQHEVFPRRFTFIFLFMYPIYYIIGRSFLHTLNKKARNRNFGVSRCLLIINEFKEGKFLRRLVNSPELGYKIYGYIMLNGLAERLEPSYNIQNLEQTIQKENIDTIVIYDEKIDGFASLNDELMKNGLSNLLKLCQEKNIKLKLISPETESILRFAYIRDIGGIPLYIPSIKKIVSFRKYLKRAFDLILTPIIMLLLSPFYILTIIAILIEDGFPIFYKQKRALISGLGEFDFYKFRSMIKGAENMQNELYSKNKTTGGLFLLDDDPRITKVGKIIRRFSIDELPQLVNVLKGDMSLVGPRPLSITDLNNIAPENKLGGFYKLRANSVPGVTGLWQISGRRTVSFKEMVLLDLYYIENQSLALDLEILFETIPVVLFGRGAY